MARELVRRKVGSPDAYLERVFVHLNALGLAGLNPGRQAAYDRVGQNKDKPTRFLSDKERGAVVQTIEQAVTRLERKRPATPSPPGSPNSVFVSTPNDVDTNTLQFLLNSASAYACPAVGQ